MPVTVVRNIVDAAREKQEELEREERRHKRQEAMERRAQVEARLQPERPEPPDERRERIAQDVARIRGGLEQGRAALGQAAGLAAWAKEEGAPAAGLATPTPTPARPEGVSLAQLPFAREEREAIERGELGGVPSGPSIAKIGLMAPVAAHLAVAAPPLAVSFPVLSAFLLEQQGEQMGLIPGRPVGRAIEFTAVPMKENLERIGVPESVAGPVAELVLFGAIGRAPTGQRSLSETIAAARQLSREDIDRAVGAVRQVVAGRRGEAGYIGGQDVIGRELDRLIARQCPPSNVSPEARNKLMSPILWQESREVTRAGEVMIHRGRIQKAAALRGVLDRETYSDVEAFIVGKGVLKGGKEMPVVAIPEGHFSAADMGEYLRAIRYFDWGRKVHDAIPTYEALMKYTAGVRVTKGELKMLARVFGPGILREKPTLVATTGNLLFDLLFAFPRTVQTAYDASAVLRQAAFATVRHTKEVFGNIPRAYLVSLFDDETARLINAEVRRIPKDLSDDALAGYEKLFFGEYEAQAGIGQREEMFFSKIAVDGLQLGRFRIRIPGVKESARGYTTYLNKVRRDIYLNTARNWQGRTDILADDYVQAADLFNKITGRGNLGPLEGKGDLLAAPFYAPRFTLSRFQAPLMIFSKSPRVRRLAAEELVSFIGVGASILAAIKMSGAADVELDPRSSNFGRIQVGPTKLDFWAGWQPIARQVVQFALAERKTSTGYVQPAARGTIAWRGLQGKFNPGFGFLVDLMQGTTFLGEEMTLAPTNVRTQMFNRLAPLFIQDVVDAVQHQGLLGGALAAPGFFGATVLTYQTAYDRITAVEDEIKQERGWTDEQVENNPGLRAEMRQDERWMAVRKELDDEAKRHGVPLEYRVGAFRREVYDATRLQQTTNDQRVEKWWRGEEGGITPREWAAREAVDWTGAFNRTDGVRQALDIEYEEEEAAPGTVAAALQAYYEVKPEDYTDLITGRVDWDGFYDARDAAVGPLSPADREYLFRAIQVNHTDLQRDHDRDLAAIRDSGYRDLDEKLWAQLAPKKIPLNDMIERETERLSAQFPDQHITRAEAIVQLKGRIPEVAQFFSEITNVRHQERMRLGWIEALLYKWGEVDKILNPEAAEWFYRWYRRWPDDFEQPPKQFRSDAYRRPVE